MGRSVRSEPLRGPQKAPSAHHFLTNPRNTQTLRDRDLRGLSFGKGENLKKTILMSPGPLGIDPFGIEPSKNT